MREPPPHDIAEARRGCPLQLLPAPTRCCRRRSVDMPSSLVPLRGLRYGITSQRRRLCELPILISTKIRCSTWRMLCADLATVPSTAPSQILRNRRAA